MQNQMVQWEIDEPLTFIIISSRSSHKTQSVYFEFVKVGGFDRYYWKSAFQNLL